MGVAALAPQHRDTSSEFEFYTLITFQDWTPLPLKDFPIRKIVKGKGSLTSSLHFSFSFHLPLTLIVVSFPREISGLISVASPEGGRVSPPALCSPYPPTQFVELSRSKGAPRAQPALAPQHRDTSRESENLHSDYITRVDPLAP